MQDVLSLDSLLGSNIPESILPDAGISLLKSDRYQMMLISSSYVISSDAVNQQIDELNTILKKYDEGGMLIGEAPCTKDLISCTDHDFEVVSLISIIAIFLIIALVLRSISLPVILVAVIETAIAANLCIPYYTNLTLPFVAPILISTIQLGSTVDYAILMTTRYLQNRRAGSDKREAVSKAVASSAQSILVSGIGFFAATFGVGLYSNVDIISSMCSLMARGALCSVVVVLFLLRLDSGSEKYSQLARSMKEAPHADNFYEPRHDAILQMTAKILTPIVILLGIYVVLNGHLSPGGGFSGGAIMGAGLMIYVTAFGFKDIRRFFTYKTYQRVVLCALLTYAASKCYSFYTGANDIHSIIPLGTPGAILSSGLILVLNICVGFIVTCTMYAFYAVFRKGEV